jgi:hypothetical protein
VKLFFVYHVFVENARKGMTDRDSIVFLRGKVKFEGWVERRYGGGEKTLRHEKV